MSRALCITAALLAGCGAADEPAPVIAPMPAPVLCVCSKAIPAQCGCSTIEPQEVLKK